MKALGYQQLDGGSPSSGLSGEAFDARFLKQAQAFEMSSAANGQTFKANCCSLDSGRNNVREQFTLKLEEEK